MTVTDRFEGALLGLAVGDAIGTTVEFRSPGSFTPMTEMVGGGPFELEPGQWTDDTSLALCLADSLIEMRGFDARDQITRYVRWWRTGYRSSTGVCFDIGNTTYDALSNFEQTGDPLSGPTDAMSSGNGSLMRLVAVPMAYSSNPPVAVELSGQSSRTTHGAKEPIDACRYFGALIAAALSGASKDQILGSDSEDSAVNKAELDVESLTPKIRNVARGSFKLKEPPAIIGSGYVVNCLEAALWAFDSTSDFESGCLAAVNLGDDADTTAAVYGQIAGAYYGASGIPERWLDRLYDSENIATLANQLYSLSTEISTEESIGGGE